VSREIARDPTRAGSVTADALHIKLRTLGIAATAGVIVSVLGGATIAERGLILVMILALLIGSSLDLIGGVFRGFHDVVLEAQTTTTSVVVGGCLGLLAVRLGSGPIGLAAGQLLGALTGLGMALVLLDRLVPLAGLTSAGSAPGLIAALRTLLPLALTPMLGNVQFQIDLLLLPHFSSAAEVGCFGVALRLIAVTLLLPAAILPAAFPALSALVGQRRRPFSLLCWRTVGFLLLAGLGGSVVGLLAAEPILRLLFGVQYLGAAPLVRILSLGLGALLPAAALGQFLIALGSARLAAGFGFATLALNLALDLYLVPRYGAAGAAWAKSVSLLVVTPLQAAALHWRLQRLTTSMRPQPRALKGRGRQP
jgi:O-antigen/teichoic acid export membrane protein